MNPSAPANFPFAMGGIPPANVDAATIPPMTQS